MCGDINGKCMDKQRIEQQKKEYKGGCIKPKKSKKKLPLFDNKEKSKRIIEPPFA